MRTAMTFISRSPEVCWRVFTDAATLTAWVPGLRRANVIANAGLGLAKEILFEFAASRTYTLAYTYDVETREVRWEPQLGKRDAVRGYAKFEPFDDGTRMTYALEEGDGRTDAERVMGDLDVLVDAFSRFVCDRHR